jgi:8-oxo-dGTP diphosphatase
MTKPQLGEIGERRIRIVAALVSDGDGRTLLVRKQGTEAFMLPGGKPVPGEGPLAALRREIEEELGCALDPDLCRPLGIFEAPAANEPGFVVSAELFAATLAGEPRPSGEIEEIAWIDPDDPSSLPLAPLARRYAMPIARELKSQVRIPAQ